MAEVFASIFVILFRTLAPLVLLRFPLMGAFLCIIADISDVMLYEAFGQGLFSNIAYHNVDKIFDIWYLFFEFIIVMTWKDKIAKRVAGSLFVLRFFGFLLFMLTAWRPSFFIAPNIFEFFFLACLIIWRYDKNFTFTWKKAGIVFLIVGIPNIIKEYIMHFKYQDQTWNFFRDHLFWWLYN